MGLKPPKPPNTCGTHLLTFDRLETRILIKVCVLLRNRFQEIRDVARGTLVKILETLGFRFLHYLLKEMQAVLVKGYQVSAGGNNSTNSESL